ncbi:tetratricopeptide repeat-containing sensor histidine kinase [Salegentibacter maritimus]|uniref:tetratricopeptide repeat-containing sensor histidine kinase n=1 Tax=Salegentibacter maritimus TaxID=2794347 RepID=UPI0018E491EE|nr:tetratricopeptide repeat-containing sensor histidine kinase [Salegentibacter maritimus]MBI6117689.1 ATP-binding protein [Salegentibacter maritimus]
MQDKLDMGIENDSAYYFFERAINEEKISAKIQNLNQSLSKLHNKKDSLYPLLLDYKIYYHNRLEEFDSALFFADSLERLATFRKDTNWIALAFYRKAVIHRYLDNQEAVFKNAFESRKHYLQIGDSTKAARRSLEMAIAQSRMQDYTGSQESAIEALRYLNREKDRQYLSSAHNIIAIAYRNQGFYNDALNEYKNALRYSKNLEDSLIYQNNIGLVYQDQKKYKKAISIFQKIYSEVPQDDYRSRARNLDNLAFTKWLRNKHLDVSLELQQALQWRKAYNDKSGLTTSYFHLSEFYKNRNKIKAIDYAKNWLETGETNTSLHSQVDALKQLLALSPSDTSYVSAYIHLSDSLKKTNLRAKNTFAKIKFDEERKQQEISSLKASAALQTIENQKIKTRNYILMFVAMLTIALAIFIFYYNRQKHKKEKIIEIYNTETRISKKIHDELANDIYNIMSGLEAVVPTKIIDKLESIYSRTRDISRENSKIDTGSGYLKQLVALLSNICPANIRLIISGENNIPWSTINREKKLVIYRVLQEFMVNMKKHSKASLVALVFNEENRYLKIHYSDNGIGTAKEAIKNGNGLQNVENRIFSINGTLTFETEKGKGLKILIAIPL